MASFYALYGTPDDPEGFEQHYRDVHLPMCDGVDGVTEVRVTRGTGTPRGGEAPYHIITEIVFAGDDEMQAALRSDAFRAVGKDAMEMCATHGVEATMIIAEDF